MFEFTQKIADFLYSWVLNSHASDAKYFINMPNGFGMEKCLFFLLAVSIFAAAVFYFIIANDIKHGAAQKNCIFTWIGGYILLIFVNYVGMRLCYPDFDAIASGNLLKISAVDALYYTVLFELASLCMKGASKAPNIHLLSYFSH